MEGHEMHTGKSNRNDALVKAASKAQRALEALKAAEKERRDRFKKEREELEALAARERALAAERERKRKRQLELNVSRRLGRLVLARMRSTGSEGVLLTSDDLATWSDHDKGELADLLSTK